MASSTPSAPPMDGADSIETLKRLREVEAESDALLASAKAESEQRLAALRASAEQDVAKAHTEAERLHDAMVSAARRETDTEAEEILDAGREEAGRVSYRTGKSLDPVRDALLDALFGEFRGGRTSSE